MSNELLTKLMDPFEKLPESMGPTTCDAKTFGDCEHQDEMCTWAAKWYLDSYLSDWMDFEDQGTNSVSELDAIIAENNPEEAFWSSSMACCKNVLHAIGITQIDELDSDEAGIDFGYITTKQVGIYFQKHVEDILDKIQTIYAARNEHAIDEADKDAVITNNLSDLRNPLNKENVDIFGLGNIPRCPDLTQDDYILWFAKLHINEGHDVLSPNNIRSAWCTSYTAFYGEEFGALGALFAICIFDPESIHGIESDVPIGNVANDCLSRFYDNNEDKIISKVKEIMKLWLEHDLL